MNRAIKLPRRRQCAQMQIPAPFPYFIIGCAALAIILLIVWSAS